MAANLARNKHRFEQLKKKLAKTESKLAACKQELKDYKAMLGECKYRSVKRVEKLKQAAQEIESLREQRAHDHVIIDGLVDVAGQLAVSLIRRQLN